MSSSSQQNFKSASEKPKEVFSFAPSLESLTKDERAKRVIAMEACGLDTCHPDAVLGYQLSIKTSKMFGSNYVAAILFTYMATIERLDNFYPIIVKNHNLPNNLQQYFMIFDDKKKVVFDFTPEIVSGGFTNYRRDIQLSVVRSALSDPTLEERVEAGLKNMNSNEDPKVAIQVFLDRFNICFQELKPEEAFLLET